MKTAARSRPIRWPERGPWRRPPEPSDVVAPRGLRPPLTASSIRPATGLDVQRINRAIVPKYAISGLAAIGGAIEASNVAISNTGAASANASAGHGAVAETGGLINLHAGVSIATGAFNAVGLGASGAGSRVVADALIPVAMNGRGAMGVYLHDGGQVTLLPGSVINLNGTSSIGVSVDNTIVPVGAIGSGLTLNFNATGVSGQAGGTGVAAFNNGQITLDNLTGSDAAADAQRRMQVKVP